MQWFGMRSMKASRPDFDEPSPYCDRLTLAEAFSEDAETQPNAEDRRAARLRVVEATTSWISGDSGR